MFVVCHKYEVLYSEDTLVVGVGMVRNVKRKRTICIPLILTTTSHWHS